MTVAADAVADPQGVTQHRASQVTQPRAQGLRQAPDGSEAGEQDEFAEGDEAEILHVTGHLEDAAGSIRSTRSDAAELIHPNDVVKAIRHFVDQNTKPTK